jgi:hypothetical protein
MDTKTLMIPTNVWEKSEKGKKGRKSQETPKPEKTKRVITNTDLWVFTDEELEPRNQIQFLHMCKNGTLREQTPREKQIVQIMKMQMRQKLSGYRSQDVEKGLFDKDAFLDLPYLLNMLIDHDVDSTTPCLCYYCKEPVFITYSYKREPKQWTVERINNSIGHNKGNCVIACLTCNVRRKTMYHERYVMTKQMVVVKHNHAS